MYSCHDMQLCISRERGIGREKEIYPQSYTFHVHTIKTQMNPVLFGSSWHGNSEIFCNYPEYPIFEGVFFIFSWANKYKN